MWSLHVLPVLACVSSYSPKTCRLIRDSELKTGLSMSVCLSLMWQTAEPSRVMWLTTCKHMQTELTGQFLEACNTKLKDVTYGLVTSGGVGLWPSVCFARLSV